MEEKKKKSIGFNIIKSDPTDGHGGFGVGALSLDNISPASSQREACFTEKVVGQMAGAKSLKITRLLGGGLFVGSFIIDGSNVTQWS